MHNVFKKHSILNQLKFNIVSWKRFLNPAFDQYHRTTRVPEYSVVSVLGGDSEMNFITKALGKHAIYSHEVFGQTASELLDFANSVATPKSYETSSGWVLNNFPANLEQAQTYEDMTDGLNLVVTTAGNNSEVANYFRSRVCFLYKIFVRKSFLLKFIGTTYGVRV